MPNPKSPLEAVRAALQAYQDKDQAAIEALIAADYHFTSPMDNALDRAAYMKICWPGAKDMAGFEIVHEAEDGEMAYVVYIGSSTKGKKFRNCEVHRVRDGQLVNTEVYFGWDVPHKVPEGKHRG